MKARADNAGQAGDPSGNLDGGDAWGDERPLSPSGLQGAGRLASIGSDERLRAISYVKTGQLFALGLDIFHPSPSPADPSRPTQLHIMYRDWSHYEKGLVDFLPGGVGSVDDGVLLNCHGGTHLDALGHIMCDGMIADGEPASGTAGGLEYGDVAAIGRLGVVCRAVIADLCRSGGSDVLARDHHVTLAELLSCLASQGTDVGRGDMVLLRTGSLLRFRQEGPHAFFSDYSEPGLSDEEELLAWVDETGLLGIGSDTLANELPRSPSTGEGYPLHHYLLRDRGLQFHEALWLEDVAASCAEDGRYTGLYMASALRLVGASGSPVNPLFMK
ncbi:MAG: cyclase family protein [Acidimicrobiales bacterium]